MSGLTFRGSADSLNYHLYTNNYFVKHEGKQDIAEKRSQIMSLDREKPWLALYGKNVPPSIDPPQHNTLGSFLASAQRSPQAPLLHYFDNTLSHQQVNDDSDALAAALQAQDISHGDCVAVYMQNLPQYFIILLAIWKTGAIMVPVNPMYRRSELEHALVDSGSICLVCQETLYREVAQDVIPASSVRFIITTSELDYLSDEVPAALAAGARIPCSEGKDFAELIMRYSNSAPELSELSMSDPALLVYTSGTTGPPKAAIISHANVATISEVIKVWADLTERDTILAIAPLFHITGLIVQMTLALVTSSPVILFHRFDPVTAASLTEQYRATFTAGAVTAFIAMLNSPEIENYDLSSLVKAYCGGAPNPPAVVAAVEKKLGIYLHAAYGLTEATAPTHYVPQGGRAPVDKRHNVLSVGIPICGVSCRIIDENGNTLPAGEIGEIAIRSPGVISGYWNKPEETAHAIRNGELRSGDIGYMDEQGWLYIVDRKKDLIIASGYKVWPREVEDALYEHPAVREAAVIGVKDEYRGESVKAFVSLKQEETADEQELIHHCREKLAAYKRPHAVTFMNELPKNLSGKILRRKLRDMQQP